MWMTTLLAWTALQGLPAAGQGAVAEAHEQRPAAATSFIAEGLRLYRHRRFRDAQRAFEQAVAADPSDAASHFYLGYTLYKIGEPTRRLTPEKMRAKEEFARCFELDQAFRPTWSLK
jgi:tetratricopeptide (TPR) repeat protein